MLGGPRIAANAGRRALPSGSRALLRAQTTTLETLPPIFLCPAIEFSVPNSVDRFTPGPSSSSHPHGSVPRTAQSLLVASTRAVKGQHAVSLEASHRNYSSQAAAASVSEHPDAGHYSGQAQVWQRNQHAARQNEALQRRHNGHTPTPRAASASSDWRRKFPSTQWRREMDFNRFSPPLRGRLLPEDAPALYEDEVKASTAWLPESQWNLTLPEDYPLRHELFLILDSLDDIAQSANSDRDRANLLVETLRQARELIWSNPRYPLQRAQDQDAALYLAGKVAETYVKLDAEDSMDRLMAFLDYVQAHIGVLPLPCFHALAARAGINSRYDAVLKICQVAQAHHDGKRDAELLHLRLRALIALSRDVALPRCWELFREAGVLVPRKTFDLLLRTYVRRQDVDQVNQLLEAMPKHGYPVDARAWLTILRGFQSFRATLAAMLRRDAKIVQSPTLQVMNRVLRMLSHELDVDGALMVLRIFRIPSIPRLKEAEAQVDGLSIINGPSPQPNVETYAILTKLFGRLGSDQEALDFFRLAVSASSGDSGEDLIRKALQSASASVMQSHLNAGHPILAMFFAADMLDLPFFGSAEGKAAPAIDLRLPASLPIKIDATTKHYRILLECAAAQGSADTARRILVHLLQEGHPIDFQVLGGLARLIFSTIDKDALEAIRVIQRLLPQNGNQANRERTQRLESLSNRLRRLGTSERIVLQSQHTTELSRSAGKVGDKKLERETHDQSSSNASKKGATTSKDELKEWLLKDLSSLFRGLAPSQDAGVVDEALVQDLSRPLSSEAYALRIRVYAVVRRDYESAQQVYHAMLTHGVRPTMMHIAPLIEGLTAVGKVAAAQRLKRNAKEVTGFQPTLRIHTALIRAYVRAGDSKAARREIEELTANGYEIDDTIANIIEAAQSGRRNFALVERPINERGSQSVATRFHALMRMRRYLAAQELLQSALDSGMRADKVLHDLVRRSVSYVQKQHAKAEAKAKHKRVASANRPTSSPLHSLQSSAGPPGLARGESDDPGKTHVLELAQAVRLARVNKERVTKAMQHHSEVQRKKMKEHRKKVVALILDFADGKLDAPAA